MGLGNLHGPDSAPPQDTVSLEIRLHTEENDILDIIYAKYTDKSNKTSNQKF